MSILINKIKKSIRIRGFFGSIAYVFGKLYKKLNPVYIAKKKKMQERDLERDLKYGIDTSGIVRVRDFETDSVNLKYANHYQPMPWLDFEKLLKPFRIDYKNTYFIDFGAGKGRSLFLAHSLPFEKIIGLELDKRLADVCKKNIQNFKTDKKINIECICGDAVEFDYPNSSILLFMYNPFEQVVMKKVITNILHHYEAYSNSFIIVYLNPIYGFLWKEKNEFSILKDEKNILILSLK